MSIQQGDEERQCWEHGQIPEEIVKAIENLDPRAFVVLRMRLGIGYEKRYLPRELSERLKITVSQVSETQVRGLRALQSQLTEEEFRLLRNSMPRGKMGAQFMMPRRVDAPVEKLVVKADASPVVVPEPKREEPPMLKETEDPIQDSPMDGASSLIARAMERFPPYARVIMRHRFGVDTPALSNEQTATHLHLTVVSVYTYVRKALVHVKASFTEEEMNALRAQLHMRASYKLRRPKAEKPAASPTVKPVVPIASRKQVTPRSKPQPEFTLVQLDDRLKNMEKMLFELIGCMRLLLAK